MCAQVLNTVESNVFATLFPRLSRNLEVFFTVYNYAGKVDLSKGYWNPKKKIISNHVFFRDN